MVLALFVATAQSYAARTGDQNLGWPGQTLAGNRCYGPAQGFGPLDYRNPRNRTRTSTSSKPPLALVEDQHFTPKVESLEGGSTAIDAYGDLSYTINAFPNHHRALWAMSRYYLRALRTKGEDPLLTQERLGKEPVPPECWFNRAMRFAPEDGVVKLIFGIYLHRRGKLESAQELYQEAEQMMPNHAELAYNFGLLYVDMGDIDNAKKYEKRARELGYPLKGLTRRISRMDPSFRDEP
jgi:tetratricopeptide (TPR) repeat protein